MNEQWSDRIRALEAAGLSQKQIAEATRLAVSSISDLKNGASKRPTGLAAVRLHQLHLEKCGPLPEPVTKTKRKAA